MVQIGEGQTLDCKPWTSLLSAAKKERLDCTLRVKYYIYNCLIILYVICLFLFIFLDCFVNRMKLLQLSLVCEQLRTIYCLPHGHWSVIARPHFSERIHSCLGESGSGLLCWPRLVESIM